MQSIPVFGKAGSSKHSKKSDDAVANTTSYSAPSSHVVAPGNTTTTQAAVAPQATPSTEKDMSGFGESSVDLGLDLD